MKFDNQLDCQLDCLLVCQLDNQVYSQMINSSPIRFRYTRYLTGLSDHFIFMISVKISIKFVFNRENPNREIKFKLTFFECSMESRAFTRDVPALSIELCPCPLPIEKRANSKGRSTPMDRKFKFKSA